MLIDIFWKISSNDSSVTSKHVTLTVHSNKPSLSTQRTRPNQTMTQSHFLVLCVLNPQHYDTAHMATSSDPQTTLLYCTSFNRVVCCSSFSTALGRSTVPFYWRKKLRGSAVKKGGVKVPGLIDGPKRELNSKKDVHRKK